MGLYPAPSIVPSRWIGSSALRAALTAAWSVILAPLPFPLRLECVDGHFERLPL
jgi:hypothetical protein